MDETPAQRLKAAREATGLSQAAFATKHGLVFDTYVAHERGKRTLTKHAAKEYAKALGIRWRELLPIDDDDEADETPPSPPPEAQQARPIDGARARDLPVWGRAVGGDDAWFEFNGERIDTIFRPPLLDGVKDAYAIFMDGESMAPRYEAGDTLYVHPGRPVRAGDYVVVQLRPKDPGDPVRALVKRLVALNSSQATLVSLNPPASKPFKIPRDQILHIHKITLSGEG